MVDNVIDLHRAKATNTTAKNPPNQNLVDVLEDLLQQAKEGQLRTLIAVGLCADGDIVDGWFTDPHAEHINPYLLLGALTALQLEFANATIQKRE